MPYRGAADRSAPPTGTILVVGITGTPERAYGLAMIVLAAVGLLGLAASLLLARTPTPVAATASRP